MEYGKHFQETPRLLLFGLIPLLFILHGTYYPWWNHSQLFSYSGTTYPLVDNNGNATTYNLIQGIYNIEI